MLCLPTRQHSPFISLFFALLFQNCIGYVYVSKNGTNIQECGSVINPCGTFYYASTLLDHFNNISTIYIIDGQNETEIQLYINNITYNENSTITNYTNYTSYYHPCLPKKDLFISYKGDQIIAADVPKYTYTVIFDEFYITTMDQWYPSICDDEYLINAITRNNYIVSVDPFGTSQIANISELVEIKSNNYYTFFDTFSNDISFPLYANFYNLVISDYYFKNLTLIWHGDDDEYRDIIYGELGFSCYNCKFINVTFSCSPLIGAKMVHLVNVTMSNISTLCNSSVGLDPVLIDITREISSTLSFENVHISDVHMKTSLFKTAYGDILWNNCRFSHIYTGYDILGEGAGSNRLIQVNNTDFAYIYPAVYLFNSGKTDYNIFADITLQNVNFIIDSAGMDNPVFETDPSTIIKFENVSVYYEYAVSRYCKIPVWFAPIHGYINSDCFGPQPFIQAYGSTEFLNILFHIEMIEIDEHHQQIADIFGKDKHEFNISYKYFNEENGLINNVGDSNEMVINNAIITPFTFYFSMIRTEKKITLNNVNIVHDNGYEPFNYNYLESEIFLFVQIPKSSVPVDDIVITNSNLNGVRNIMFAVLSPLRTFHISNSYISNAMGFISATIHSIQEMILENSHFENSYNKMIDLQSVSNLIINSSHFRSYGREEMIYISQDEHDQSYIRIENNSFDYSEKTLLSKLEKEYFLWILPSGDNDKRSFVITARYMTEVEIISNYFGYTHDDNYPSMHLYKTNTCFSNNTFHNYGVYANLQNNITSCYKKNMLTHCERNQCCNRYGEIKVDLIDKTGYFILNNTSVEPIKSIFSYGFQNIELENIVFQVLDNRTDIRLPFAAQLLYTDTSIQSTHDVDFTFIVPQCNLLCNQLTSNQFTTQIKMECDSSVATVEDIRYSAEWNGTELISHATPHSLVLRPINNGSYFPGEFMKFDYFILDKFGNIINFTDYDHAMTIVVSIVNEQFSYSEQITVDENGYCFFCDSGLYIPSITLQHIGQTFVLNTEDSNNELIVPDIEIFVLQCPIAYGIDAFGYHCIECPADYYQLSANSTEYCKTCKYGNEANQGFKCNGGDSITVSHHHWIAIKGIYDIHVDGIFPTYTESIISSSCPYLYCCEILDGCDFLLNSDSLCALNRDPNVPLCGACKIGYTESMNGSNCLKCDGQTIYPQWLFYPFCLAVIFTVYLIVSNSYKPKTSKSSQSRIKNPNNYSIFRRVVKNKRLELMVVLMMTKCVIYFEQSMSQILLSGSIIVNLSTLSSLFDLSLTSLSNSDSKTGCFINGLNAKYKIVSSFITTVMIVMLVIFIALIMNNSKICHGQRKLSVVKAFIKLLLLCTGQILSIIFKLLSCQKIGNNSNYFVHFYFGNEECYGSTWFASFVGLVCIMIIFVILFVKLKRMDALERGNKKNALAYVLTRAYKNQYYFWEFVILIRRITVIFIAISFKSSFASLSLIIILLICVFLQYKCQPFIMNEINDMEMMLLCCLIIAISIQIALSAQSDYFIAYILLVLLIIFPFILLLYYILLNIHKIKIGKKANNDDLFLLKQRIKYLMLSIIVCYSSTIATYEEVSLINESNNLKIETDNHNDANSEDFMNDSLQNQDIIELTEQTSPEEEQNDAEYVSI